MTVVQKNIVDFLMLKIGQDLFKWIKVFCWHYIGKNLIYQYPRKNNFYKGILLFFFSVGKEALKLNKILKKFFELCRSKTSNLKWILEHGLEILHFQVRWNRLLLNGYMRFFLQYRGKELRITLMHFSPQTFLTSCI